MRLAPCQLKAIHGPKIRTAPPGYNWYQHITFGFHNGEEFVTLPGRVQIRHRNKRTESTTSNDNNAGVMGYNLAWLIKEAGHEPISDNQYWEEKTERLNAENAITSQISHHLMEND